MQAIPLLAAQSPLTQFTTKAGDGLFAKLTKPLIMTENHFNNNNHVNTVLHNQYMTVTE